MVTRIRIHGVNINCSWLQFIFFVERDRGRRQAGFSKFRNFFIRCRSIRNTNRIEKDFYYNEFEYIIYKKLRYGSNSYNLLYSSVVSEYINTVYIARTREGSWPFNRRAERNPRARAEIDVRELFDKKLPPADRSSRSTDRSPSKTRGACRFG